MIEYCALSFWHNLGHSPVRLLLVELLASVVLIRIVDWHGKMQAERKRSSIEELELLFARVDCRPSQDHRRLEDQ